MSRRAKRSVPAMIMHIGTLRFALRDSVPFSDTRPPITQPSLTQFLKNPPLDRILLGQSNGVDTVSHRLAAPRGE